MVRDSTRMIGARTRDGFSLVEALVVIALMTLLMAITLPAFNRAREAGRDTTCKSNLRQIGFGLIQYADTHNTLCSGAWDWKHDGCLSEVGWVADLVAQGILVDQLKCASNPIQLSDQYQALLTFDPASNACADSLGTTSRMVGGVPTDNICRQLSARSDPASRVELLIPFLEDGFNTNYVATWLMTRSDVRLDNSGSLGGDTRGCPSSLMNRNSTAGPMHRGRIGMSSLSSTVIPLMGCAQVGDISDSFLETEVGEYYANTRLAEGTTDGPLDPNTMKVPLTGSGTGTSAWGPYWTKTLQDYRDFGAVHGGRACNVLFLDGNVGQFTDANGDGFLNNGFKPNGTNGFTDDTIELPKARIYSGWSLNPSRIVRNR